MIFPYVIRPLVCSAMKSAPCGTDNDPVTALMSSIILDPLVIKMPSSEEKQRFVIALKTLELSPKMHVIQVTASHPTAAQPAKHVLSNREEREEQAAGKRVVKSRT